MTQRVAKPQLGVIAVDAQPTFELSPYLFMQFMESLGSTDPSVEAGWNFRDGCWREDLVEVTRALKPGLIRWPGGTLTSYYRWKEAVGPRSRRKPLYNLTWDGMETNHVGTHEFIDFCQQVGADPLMVVNFESDGEPCWMRDPEGRNRCAGPREAAAWVDYCNNSRNAMRRKNGASEPFNVRLWQIGNETSYSRTGFECETAVKRTVAFAKAMRKADPRIDLIGWGDRDPRTKEDWAPRMLEVAGEHLQYIAFHHHWGSALKNSPLRPNEYRKNPEKTWRHLMSAHRTLDKRIREMRRNVAGSSAKLAMTEGHFALPGHTRCSVLASWAAGVAYARHLNVQARNGDVLKIATLADFCGSLWNVNAIMLHCPRGGRNRAFMMPVARIMSLYRRHMGKYAVDVTAAPADLDVTASRTRSKVFLYVVNTNRTQAVRTRLSLAGERIASGTVFEIAADPTFEVNSTEPDTLEPAKRALPASGVWRFPPASVSAIELRVVQEAGKAK